MGITSPYPPKQEKSMKPNIWVSSSQANEMLAKQLKTWSLAHDNFQALKNVRLKEIRLDDCLIKIQFNPARAISTTAKVDKGAILDRPCFLCVANLPVEQERLPFGFHYLVLCNPYPIFQEHFTIPARRHEPQRILCRLNDLLTIARRLNRHTIFYNGPRCGASAPDHAHFQAVTQGVMPIDQEIGDCLARQDDRHLIPLGQAPGGSRLWRLERYWRNGFVIEGNNQEEIATWFKRVFDALPRSEDEEEPKMNLFAYYNDKTGWRLVIIPRKAHRPRQYFAEGEERLLSSPGAADVGGLLILPVERDFERMDESLLRDLFGQTCYDDETIRSFQINTVF